MSFLRLNGIPVPVQRDSLTITPFEVGERGRAHDGSPLVSRQRLIDHGTVEGETTLKTQAEAWAFRKLIDGSGFYWSFDASLYSDRGLGPSGTTGTVTQSNSGGKVGGKVALGATASLEYATALGAKWTIAIGRSAAGADDYHQYIRTSDGDVWEDGSHNGASTPFLSVDADGNVTIQTTGTAFDFCELVALPFVVPSDWPPLMWTRFDTDALPSCPRFRPLLSGDVLAAGGEISVTGEVTKVTPVRAAIGGDVVGWKLSFRLQEV